jgi:hypothetical protein
MSNEMPLIGGSWYSILTSFSYFEKIKGGL